MSAHITCQDVLDVPHELIDCEECDRRRPIDAGSAISMRAPRAHTSPLASALHGRAGTPRVLMRGCYESAVISPRAPASSPRLVCSSLALSVIVLLLASTSFRAGRRFSETFVAAVALCLRLRPFRSPDNPSENDMSKRASRSS